MGAGSESAPQKPHTFDRNQCESMGIVENGRFVKKPGAEYYWALMGRSGQLEPAPGGRRFKFCQPDRQNPLWPQSEGIFLYLEIWRGLPITHRYPTLLILIARPVLGDDPSTDACCNGCPSAGLSEAACATCYCIGAAAIFELLKRLRWILPRELAAACGCAGKGSPRPAGSLADRLVEANRLVPRTSSFTRFRVSAAKGHAIWSSDAFIA